MATITKSRLNQARQHSAPYGNKFADTFRYETNSSGVALVSDAAAATAINDKVRLGIIEAGTVLLDATVVVSDAFAASTTADIGFEYVDGVDSTAVPQDADYFFAGQATSSTALARKATATAPVRLPKDAYLVLTRKGAADSAVGILDVIVDGIKEGVA